MSTYTSCVPYTGSFCGVRFKYVCVSYFFHVYLRFDAYTWHSSVVYTLYVCTCDFYVHTTFISCTCNAYYYY